MTSDVESPEVSPVAGPVAVPALSEDAEREARTRERIVIALRNTRDGIVRIFQHLRFVVFLIYLVLAAAAFWLWVIATVLDLIRFGLRCLLRALLWIGGGQVRVPGQPTLLEAIRAETRRMWTERTVHYEVWARPVATHYVAARRAVVHFWHWKLHQKVAAILVAILLVGTPALYVVPRPQYVQITDDNAIDYEPGVNNTMTVRYLVHAVDLRDSGAHREYQNEQVWWLGKINPQGLKSQLVPGRYYKLMIVGVRWYFLPTLYPNIISAAETDEEGNVLNEPSQFLPSTRTGK